MMLPFYNDSWTPEREERRDASLRYWMAKGCSKEKAHEMYRREGFKKSHEAFYRAPRRSGR